MLITPHQVALLTDHTDLLAPNLPASGARWTWVAGRRYRGVRRL
jgi:hypothetical protein